MRSILLILPLLIVFTSCQVYNQYPSAQVTLTNIKFTPSEAPLDIFFVEESKPQRDYIRIAIVEESIVTNNPRTNQLLESLRKQSQALGADALLVMNQESLERNSDVTNPPRQRMSGLAIRYADNIQFSEDQLSHLEITTPTNESTEVLRFNAGNELNNDFNSRSALVAYHFSLHYLLESTKGWTFSKVPVTGGNILYRRHKAGLETLTSIKTTEYKNGQLGEIKINRLNRLSRNITMELHYDNQGQIVKRNWTDSNPSSNYSGKYEVIPTYDQNNRLVQEQYYRQSTTERSMKPFVTIDYHYYNAENIEQVLENEQVVRVR